MATIAELNVSTGQGTALIDALTGAANVLTGVLIAAQTASQAGARPTPKHPHIA